MSKISKRNKNSLVVEFIKKTEAKNKKASKTGSRKSLDTPLHRLEDLDKEEYQTRQPINEFRKNKITQHPAYLYLKTKRTFIYKNITENPLKNVEYIDLINNPEPNNTEKSYMTKGSYIARKESFKSKNLYNDWKLSSIDKKKVEKTFLK